MILIAAFPSRLSKFEMFEAGNASIFTLKQLSRIPPLLDTRMRHSIINSTLARDVDLDLMRCVQ